MKQGKEYKQKLSRTVSFDADKTPVETVDHPSFTRPGEDLLAGEAANAGDVGPTRDEAEARLKDHGLSQVERAVVLAHHFEHKSRRALS